MVQCCIVTFFISVMQQMNTYRHEISLCQNMSHLFHSPLVNGHTQPRRPLPQRSSEVTCCAVQQHRPQPQGHQPAPHSSLLGGATYQMPPDMGPVQLGGSANLQLRMSGKEKTHDTWKSGNNYKCFKFKTLKISKNPALIIQTSHYHTAI